ncbi:hypothetical protein E2562_034107 [Oryza meyeriana var. granulata]|uniref:Uncharacterized protein n=1 Tax=Oryza meyeriana var. granulata TaxID=110450 RepID=A0A6G1E6B2_9ORYZ|nr:hypothetical protein E2562_034107 [Oryza meyeriana var. granulata]
MSATQAQHVRPCGGTGWLATCAGRRLAGATRAQGKRGRQAIDVPKEPVASVYKEILCPLTPAKCFLNLVIPPLKSYPYAESTEAGHRTAGRSSAAAPEAQARSHAGSSTRGHLAGRSSGRASLASSSA